VRRVELGGLTAAEAAEVAEDVLRPYPAGRARREERAFAELMAWLNGHPLSLRLLLPQLERVSAADLLAGLKGNAVALPAGFAGEGRLASLGASLKYSFNHLVAEMRSRVVVLSLFEGVADEDVLSLLSRAKSVPARFAEVSKEDWSALLQRLAAIGVLTELHGGMYGLHPALPSYLAAEWRHLAGEGFATEQAATEQALLAAYAAFGDWLLRQVRGGSAQTAFALIDRQRRTMGRLLGLALTQQNWDAAQEIMQPLNQFWNARGLGQEARGWVDCCRAAPEDRQGNLPDLDSEAGALWLFAVGSEANRARGAGRLDDAYAVYDAIRQKVEAAPGAAEQKPRLAVVYHQLGVTAQDGGDLAGAAVWYRKSLAIDEALGDRRGMSTGYHQLGMIAQERGDLAAAEGWYQKSLAIDEALGDRPGVATSYHQLGTIAQQRDDLAAAGGVVSQVTRDQGGTGRPTTHGQQLSSDRHRGAETRRSAGGGSVVSQVAGGRRGPGRPAPYGQQLPPARHGGAGSGGCAGGGGVVSQVAGRRRGAGRPARHGIFVRTAWVASGGARAAGLGAGLDGSLRSAVYGVRAPVHRAGTATSHPSYCHARNFSSGSKLAAVYGTSAAAECPRGDGASARGRRQKAAMNNVEKKMAMEPEAADLARRAAAGLSGQFGARLPADIEAALQGGAAGRQYIDPVTIALATLVLNVAKFAWDIYKDNKKAATPPPNADAVARRIRLEVELPSDVTEGQRDQVVAAVIAELPRS
jgi:tetratricopeptide (TPR) repeat protein